MYPRAGLSFFAPALLEEPGVGPIVAA